MNVDSVRAFCMEFPEATEKLQWEDELCFKIRGKIFAMVGLDRPRMVVKCAPDIFEELIEREDIRPSPYLGRYKWVMLDRLDAVGWGELQELIRQSYAMVAAGGGEKIAGREEENEEDEEKGEVKARLRSESPGVSWSKVGR
jgi:predicted DNA-binding protein (MmcQ/YjbR family)